MARRRDSEKEEGFASPSAIVKAGPDGHYELQLARSGEFYMQAGGFDPPCGGSNAVPVTLAEGDQRVVDLVFSGEHVSVLVVGASDGRPLQGARVTLISTSDADPLSMNFSFGNAGDRTEFWPYADAEGRAELPFTMPGSYSLRCELEEHVTTTVPLTVTAGTPQDVRVELEAAARLRGSVRLSSGVPAKDGLWVTLHRDQDSDDQEHSTWIQGGEFVIGRLAGGDYRLTVRDESTGRPNEAPLLELPVTLKPGEDKSVELQLPP